MVTKAQKVWASVDSRFESLESRISELQAENQKLRNLLSDIDKATIWESGGTVPDRSMQGRVDAALEVKGKN